LLGPFKGDGKPVILWLIYQGQVGLGAMERRIGLEQEFFLVDGTGRTSDRADGFLALCRETAGREGLDPAFFVGECTGSMVEINTPPSYTVEELAGSYLASLDLALRAG
jgi:gamma-glutamyl:cysteine ligase YbdK (ATP-grasp superfamily)